MKLSLLIVGGALLLAACGDKTASTEGPAALANDPKTADCDKRPDFATVYPGARFTGCLKTASPRPDHESGTVMYVVEAQPAAILAWQKQQANAAGLKDSLVNPRMMYSARDGDARSLMAIVQPNPEGSGAAVQINWGRDLK